MAIDLGPDGLTLGSTTINDWDDVGGGKLLQVVQEHYNSFPSSSDGTAWHTYQTINITPQSSSSIILIQHVVAYGGGNNSYACGRCLRGSTTIKGGDGLYSDTHFDDASYGMNMNNSNDTYKVFSTYFQSKDSPNTTAQTTYTFQYRPDDANRQVTINHSVTNPGSGYVPPAWTSTTLMEIAG